jgi:tripeptide aminopeptidase
MKEDIVKKFKRYVQVNSESGDEKEFASILIEELKVLGLKVEQDKLTEAHHSNTSNIVATLEGDGDDSIFLCAHMDTVKPGLNIEPYEKEGNIYSKGDTILGADDKAGIAVIMSTLEKIIDEKIPHRCTEVVFTVHEEGSLYGSKALDYSLIQSKKGVVLDSSGEVGGIVIKAPSKEKISAEVIGKSSHAGIAPEKGINAIGFNAKDVNVHYGYEIAEEDFFVQEIIKAGENAEIKMFTRDSKGGSDANVFNNHGIKTVNLVIGTQNAHTMDEYITIDSLMNCAKVIYNLVSIKKES